LLAVRAGFLQADFSTFSQSRDLALAADQAVAELHRLIIPDCL
jgi:hypothetical protein